MARYADTIVNETTGQPIAGMQIFVYLVDYTATPFTVTLANLTNDQNAAITQPLVSDEDGGFYYNAADGTYRHDHWVGGKLVYRTERVGVGSFDTVGVPGDLITDVNEAKTAAEAAQLAADNLIALSGVPAGSVTLGAFNSMVLSDNQDIKAAVSQLAMVIADLVPRFPSPFTDTFSGDGNLNARTGWVVEARDSGTGAHTDDLETVNGELVANPVDGGTGAFGLHDSGAGDLWVTRVRSGDVHVNGLNVDHVTTSGTGSDYIRGDFAVTSQPNGLLQGNYVLQSVLNNVSQGNLAGDAITFIRNIDGDNIQHRYEGTMLTVYHNGRAATGGSDVASLGITLNGKCGLDDGIRGPVEFFSAGNPQTDGLISLYQPAHVVQRNADGSATWQFSGEYKQGPLTVLQYTLYDLSSGSPVPLAGHTNQVMTGFAAADGVYSGVATVAAGSLTSGGPFVPYVERSGLEDDAQQPASAFAPGPRQWIGETAVITGQSNATRASRASEISSIVEGQPGAGFVASGEPSGQVYDRKMFPISNNCGPARFANTIAALGGGGVGYGNTGRANTTVGQRGPATASYVALEENIKHLSAQRGVIFDIGGSSDALVGGTAEAVATQYKADMLALYNGLLATYPDIIVSICPLARMLGNDEAKVQAIRQAQWQICQENPDLFKWGHHALDFQYDIVGGVPDDFHYIIETDTNMLGVGEANRRMAYWLANYRGFSTQQRVGPSLTGVERIDAQTIRCTYDLNGMDAGALVNSEYANEHHGGMRFAATNDPSAPIWPTGHTVSLPLSSNFTIEFEFPADSFPTEVFVWAMYGADPINPTNNTNVNLDILNRASMIVGTKAGEPNIACQPYFSGAAGTDFLSAT